ncbi:IclR family transcriptional regulator [Pseudonocardia sp. CA-142604]|uniref:IclR family transcriptional regulator n=1 Tax=Pseudonocardia sp. CA-142604 TaxID=3240024 RepID=UPI003D8AD6F3
MSSDVPAVEKAIRILERLAAEYPRPVSPATLVADLALNRSTCYGILATLRAQGWGASPERAGWTLGPRLLTVTRTGEHTAEVVREELDELSRRLGAVTVAVVPDGSGKFVVVATGECTQGIRVSIGIGDRLPEPATAVRQVAAAWGVPGAASRHRLSLEMRDHAEVLTRVRADGFGRSAGAADQPHGVAAAAAFDVDGRVRLVVTVLAMPDRKPDEEIDRIGRAVRDAAAAISTRTGGASPTHDVRSDPPVSGVGR